MGNRQKTTMMTTGRKMLLHKKMDMEKHKNLKNVMISFGKNLKTVYICT